ncbi:putative hydrolase YxeP [Variibacter gotjawalensis]|uniref:Putative hydrolase YxeP n=1 Tax=Variibacter gotjawalensis TaxID=1333996 RepID=A0A0S3PWF0_9BRAD|nr:amidohydrolase [Variibacter gotjawalensis]NIK45938.1 amidohydrolase [Variibacter gotjawalensis]RZS47858.1 carboxypeptidase Ss1 [Variibacter gotjawalensis]BAT60112.1 putative hydrolase YxeP [Variibacter gotjawalensis]
MLFFKRTQSRFFAEPIDLNLSRRALLHVGCACAAFSLMRPVAALAQSIPTPAAAPARPIHAKLDQAAKAIEAKMLEWRRDIHQHPELGNQEKRTAGIVAEHLKSLGYEVREGVATTGVVGVLKGEGGPGPVIAVRADMDALPVAEQVDLPFASKVKTRWNGEEVGVMHACGHDCHVAIQMAVAEIVAGMRKELRGTVKLIFQPAEEGLPIGETGGARVMVEQGVMADPKPDAVFGLHVSSAAPVGVVSYRPGPTMAGSDTFKIVVKGRQTHGAVPWGGVDPITIGATIVTTLQTIISRETDIQRNPAVVTIGIFKGGQRQNIISDSAELVGTLRTYSEPHRAQVKKRIGEIAENIARGMNGSAEVAWNEFAYPPLVNDVALVEKMAPTLARTSPKLFRLDHPASPSEDFSFFANVVPGLFFFVGIAAPDDKNAAPNHSPRFRVEEAGLMHGLRGMLHLVADYTGSGTD